MKITILTGLLCASTALMTSSSIAQTQQQNGAACDRLVTALGQPDATNPPVTADEARTLQRAGDQERCGEALARLEGGDAPSAAGSQDAEAGRVVVRQPAPAVAVEQASPTVSVQQAQPNVTVRQPQPEIVVQQPAPTVTIDIPQPIITLRMPEPQVAVAMPRPDVQVEQPEPQVSVAQSEAQPQVEVERGQPQVQLQAAANAQPNVDVQGGDQPQVRYERAEPRIVVNRPEGQPEVRVERQSDGSAPERRQGAADGQAAPDRTADARESRNVGSDDLLGMDVVNAQGEQIGDVDRLLRGQDGEVYLVIGHGGFLGLGEKEVALPVDRAALRNDRLVVEGMTVDQIRAMPAYEDDDRRYESVASDFSTPVRTSSAAPSR